MRALVLALVLLTGCASAAPQPKDARAVLYQAVEYAQAAAEATKAVCTFQSSGEACEYLIGLLDKAFAKGAQIEAALNAGEDVSAAVKELEDELKAVESMAQSILKGML